MTANIHNLERFNQIHKAPKSKKSARFQRQRLAGIELAEAKDNICQVLCTRSRVSP